jgi:hypothetical protein
LAPSDSEVLTTHEWQNHELAGDDDPVRISAVDMGRTTVLADRAHRFATIRRPPALEAGGGDCPLVGLDATGRSELWETVLGTDMRRRDPHGSAAARREFLRHQGLRVVQTTPEAKTYGGSVDAGSMDGDTAVVEAAADEYAPQVGDDPAVVRRSKPNTPPATGLRPLAPTRSTTTATSKGRTGRGTSGWVCCWGVNTTATVPSSGPRRSLTKARRRLAEVSSSRTARRWATPTCGRCGMTRSCRRRFGSNATPGSTVVVDSSGIGTRYLRVLTSPVRL